MSNTVSRSPECPCPLEPQTAIEVRQETGIGDRTIWSVIPQDEYKEDDVYIDESKEGLMCSLCGRIYQVKWSYHHKGSESGLFGWYSHWTPVDRVNPQTMDHLTEDRHTESGDEVPWEFIDHHGRAWRILRYFEFDGGVEVLADCQDLYGERQTAMIALFPKIEGIGNRQQIDWSHLKMGVRGYSIEIERRFETLKRMIRMSASVGNVSAEIWETTPEVPVTVRYFDQRLTEDEERGAIEWNNDGLNCLCGTNDLWQNMDRVMGIGNREAGWERSRREDCSYIMCENCGRIYDWDDKSIPLVDRVNLNDLNELE